MTQVEESASIPGRRWARNRNAGRRQVPTPELQASSREKRVCFVERGERHEFWLNPIAPLRPPQESPAAKEYRLQLRARYLLIRGRSKEQVADELEQALGWVTQSQMTPVAQLKRPKDVPPYVSDCDLRMPSLGIEPFRPAALMRGYAKDTKGLYLECAQAMPWRQAVFRKRNYETGEVKVTNIASSRQDCSYPGLSTGISRLDEVLQRLQRDLDIKDLRAFLLNNFYPDGNTSIAPHQHDFWSAILSLGASRVFTVDGDPVLLNDGDVIVIGTQRHSVPKMPEVKDGRVSVAIFWYPESRGPVCDSCGAAAPFESKDGFSYCQSCWNEWVQAGGDEAEDDAMLQAALQLSMLEQ